MNDLVKEITGVDFMGFEKDIDAARAAGIAAVEQHAGALDCSWSEDYTTC